MKKVVGLLLLIFVISSAVFAHTSPFTVFYEELKTLTESGLTSEELQAKLSELLEKYYKTYQEELVCEECEATYERPISLPSADIDLSELDRALFDLGIEIKYATVEVFNNFAVFGPYELYYNRETGETTGEVSKLKAGKYAVVIKVFGKVDGQERIIAIGRASDVTVERDKLTNVEIPLTLLVGTGGMVINATIDFQSSEFIPGDIVLTGLEDGAEDVLPDVELSWESLRAQKFDLFFGEDPENLVKIAENLEVGYYNISGLTAGQRYYWKVVAKNIFGYTESKVFTFKIGDAPTVPSNPVPYDGAIKVWYEPMLQWDCEKAESYELHFGKNPENLEKFETAENKYKPELLELGTQYYWKVVAKNKYGTTEGPVWNFTVGNVPTKPEFTSPFGDEVWIEPEIVWTSEDADEYDLYIGTDEMKLEHATTTKENKFVPTLEKDTQYFVKVVARNDFGFVESDIHTFKTGGLPSVPVAISPKDGEEDVWNFPILEWKSDRAEYYNLYFGADPENLELIAENLQDSMYGVDNLELGKTYYWKVQAFNRFGDPEGPVWKFTVGNVPGPVVLESPAINEEDVYKDVLFKWESTKAKSYEFYLGVSPETLVLVDEVEESLYEAYNLNLGTTYYWKVVAKNEFGSTESEIGVFTVGNVPQNLKILYPEGGQKEVEISPKLAWTAEKADKFHVYLSTVYDELELAYSGEETEYQTQILHFGTEYKWKVVAENIFGTTEIESLFRVKLPTVEKSLIYGGSDNETVKKIRKTLDGGFIIVGNTQSTEKRKYGESDIVVIKLNKDLEIEWEQVIGGNGRNEASDITETETGYVVVGYTLAKSVNSSTSKGGWDVLVASLDKTGKLSWQKLYGGTGNDMVSGVIATKDGNTLIVGTTNSVNGETAMLRNPLGNQDVWLFIIDKDGNLVRSNRFGGKDNDIGVKVFETENDFSVIATTYSLEGDVIYNHGFSDLWVFKVDKKLENVTFSMTYGGTQQDEASDILPAADGNILVVGFTNSNDGDVQETLGSWDFWVVKIDQEGNIIWQKTYGGKDEDVAYGASEFLDGGFAVVGRTSSRDLAASGNKGSVDILVVDIDNNGNLRWSKTFGGPLADYGISIAATEDGGLVIGGTTFSRTGDVKQSFGGSDIWIIKVK